MIKYVWNVGRDTSRAPLRWLALLVLVVLPLAMPRAAAADTPPFAGVVVQYANGNVREYCVNLGSDGVATGEEALRAAIQPIVVEYGMNGAAVCKIDNTGCDFPAQNCFCQCADPTGDDCIYWRYLHLTTNNTWQYSAVGASTYTVNAGAVEGWAWGNGDENQGATPPVRTFEQICAPLLATPSPTRTVFISPTATSTPTPTATPTITNTPLPTATVTPVTPQPSTITATPTRTLTPIASGTANPAVTNTPVPSVAVPTATQAIPPTAPPNVPNPTATTAPTATVESAATESATPVILPPTSTVNLSPTPSATIGAPVVMVNTPTVANIVMPIATSSLPSDSPDSATDEQPLWLYGLFGVIVLGLVTVVGVVAYSQRMGR